MTLIGVWPDDDQGFVARNIAWFNAVGIFTMILLPTTAGIVYLLDDMEDLVGNLVISVPVALLIYKILLLRVRRDAIETILEGMAIDWTVTRTGEEWKAMIRMAKYTRLISMMSVGLAIFVMVTISARGISSARFERPLITNETKIGVGFLYPSWFPYDTKAFQPFVWSWLAQWLATVIGIFGYSAPDSSISMLILHLCGQLATLRLALVKIVDEESIKDPSVYWKRLTAIVKRHQELNRVGELIERSFKFMLLMQMLVTTFTFCFQGFVMITTVINGWSSDEKFPIVGMMFCIANTLYTILHLYVYCWTGDLLTSESLSLSFAPYESDWFLLSAVQARNLMMITNRARIPLQITAGKFVAFSLNLLTSIIKTSMGYLSVLLAMKET